MLAKQSRVLFAFAASTVSNLFLRLPVKSCRTKSSKMALADLRVNYSHMGLDESQLPQSPLPLFAEWISEAEAVGEPESNAMCLSTASATGRPSARMVLLKGFDERGFVWYTNYESRKAQDLGACPYAALTFWWAGLERSVRIEGITAKIPSKESDEYFDRRPPLSRLGAWASDQSRVASGREAMTEKWQDLQDRHLADNGDVRVTIPRPAHWGGYRLVPDRIEFWKGREARLHDRIEYTRSLPEDLSPSALHDINNDWKRMRLQP